MSKKNEQHDEHMDETWLIPYADLLTLLLALFIVLFASGQVDQKKFTAMKEAFTSVFMSTGGAGVIGEGGRGGYGDGSGDNIIINPSGWESGETAESQEPATSGSEKTTETGGTGGIGIPINIKVDKLQKSFEDYINDHKLQDKLHTRVVGQTVMIVISDVVLFDSGSAEIKPDFYETIHAIGNILAENSGLEVQVLGHTDNVPIMNSRYETNWDLSASRALNFMKMLLSDKRLDPSRYSAIGYGEFRPVASNKTETGKAQNRRVEVTAHFIS